MESYQNQLGNHYQNYTQDHEEEDKQADLPSTLSKDDDVNPSGNLNKQVETVVQEKLVYYCSSFDLNVNEWFNEYENIQIFKRRMKSKLGQNWVKYFYQAIEIHSSIDFESDCCNDSEDLSSEDTEDIASNHCLNIAIEYYLLNSQSKTEENSFDVFHNGMRDYFLNKGYKIVDDSLFKSLAHTFHIIAESEEENIVHKKKVDENFDREYRKTIKKREIKKRGKQESVEEEKEPPKEKRFITDTIQRRKLKNMIPGFSLIKNKIITPLLIASEKVVEYMIPDSHSQKTDEPASIKITEKVVEPIEDQNIVIEQRMSKLSLEDERKQRKRTLKYLRKSNQNINISQSLIKKASDCVDFISERTQVESKVTQNFVTNMIELSDSAVSRISSSCEGLDNHEQINMRFIKPSKKFYNLLMSVWVKMDISSIFRCSEESFIENVKQALLKENLQWVPEYLKPTKAFFNIAKEEFMNLNRIQKDDAQEMDEEPKDYAFSMSMFFSTIMSNLLEMWNSEIVDKSWKFNFASASKSEADKNKRSKETETDSNQTR